MAFITKNANIILLLLIIFASIGLAASTVYFQDTLGDVNYRYDEKLDELNTIQADLEVKQKQLVNLVSELSLKETRETELTGKFVEKEEKLSATEDELAETLNEKEKLERDISQLRNQVTSLNAQKADLEIEVSNLESDVSSWKSKYNSCDNDLDDCEDDLNACLNP
jgi:chromosome segregation ATPase